MQALMINYLVNEYRMIGKADLFAGHGLSADHVTVAGMELFVSTDARQYFHHLDVHLSFKSL